MLHRAASTERRHGRRLPTRAAASLLVLACLLLGGCKPLYLPPVPDSPTAPVHTRLGSTSALAQVTGRPVLTVVLAELVAPEGGGWLNVQWFGPSNTELASDSAWVTSDDVGMTLTFALPEDVAFTPGEWRAAVSFGGFLLRQFTLEVTPRE